MRYLVYMSHEGYIEATPTEESVQRLGDPVTTRLRTEDEEIVKAWVAEDERNTVGYVLRVAIEAGLIALGRKAA
jgi:hypothetical protein